MGRSGAPPPNPFIQSHSGGLTRLSLLIPRVVCRNSLDSDLAQRDCTPIHFTAEYQPKPREDDRTGSDIQPRLNVPIKELLSGLHHDQPCTMCDHIHSTSHRTDRRKELLACERVNE
jgi:hypothetical protein